MPQKQFSVLKSPEPDTITAEHIPRDQPPRTEPPTATALGDNSNDKHGTSSPSHHHHHIHRQRILWPMCAK